MRDDLRLRTPIDRLWCRSMPEDPRTFFERTAARQAHQAATAKAKSKKHATDFLENLRGRRVRYYPGCSGDFRYPLHRFRERCDIFVFCDWLFGSWDNDA